MVRIHPFIVGAGAVAALVLLGQTPAHAADAADGAIAVSVDGGRFSTSTITVPVLGDITAVPGDSGTKTITVRNDGKTAGTLTAQISDASLSGDPGGAFLDSLRIDGRPASEMLDGGALIAKTPLDVGSSALIPLSFDFPADATIGGTDASSARFDVTLTLTGTASGAGRSGLLAFTGQPVAAAAATGGAFLAAGMLLLLLRRRRAEARAR